MGGEGRGGGRMGWLSIGRKGGGGQIREGSRTARVG